MTEWLSPAEEDFPTPDTINRRAMPESPDAAQAKPAVHPCGALDHILYLSDDAFR